MIRIKILAVQEAIKKTAREAVVFPSPFWVLCPCEVCVTAEGTAVSDRLCRVVVAPLGTLVDGMCPAPEGFLTGERGKCDFLW